MNKFAIIENTRVKNITVSSQPLDQSWVALTDDSTSIGDHYIDGQFIAKEPDMGPIVEIEPPMLIKIHLTEVHNAKQTNSSLTRVTTEEGEIVIAKGTIDMPDKSLILTFARNDETKKQYKFGVDLVDGHFEIALSFKETGQYIFTDEQANLGLVEPMFTVDAVTVDVLTKTT